MKIKILIVDDLINKVISLKIIFGLLEEEFNHEFIIDWAETGKDALGKIKQNKYSIIIMDGHLPDEIGPNIVKQIRENNKEVVILMFSGDNIMNELGIKNGANDDLLKYGATKVIEVIRKYLQQIEVNEAR